TIKQKGRPPRPFCASEADQDRAAAGWLCWQSGHQQPVQGQGRRTGAISFSTLSADPTPPLVLPGRPDVRPASSNMTPPTLTPSFATSRRLRASAPPSSVRRDLRGRD